jgi:hypothetical protein
MKSKNPQKGGAVTLSQQDNQEEAAPKQKVRNTVLFFCGVLIICDRGNEEFCV